MLSMIENGNQKEAHPAYWAPFIVVGEGSPTETESQGVAPETPAVAVPPPAKRAATKREVPWTGEIWRQRSN